MLRTTITSCPNTNMYNDLLNIRGQDNIHIIADVSDLLYLDVDVDTVVRSILIDLVSTGNDLISMYEHAVEAVGNFFSSCGFKSQIDYDNYDLVNRIIGLDSLFSSIEDLHYTINKKMEDISGGWLAGFNLVKWLDQTPYSLQGIFWIAYD